MIKIDNTKILYLDSIVSGSPHKTIKVNVDITAPLYLWKNLGCYTDDNILDNIFEKEFTIDSFSHEYLSAETDSLWENSDGSTYDVSPYDFCNIVCDVLNYFRYKYLQTGDCDYKFQAIQLLPISYLYKLNVNLDYEDIRNISTILYDLNEYDRVVWDKWVSNLNINDSNV